MSSLFLTPWTIQPFRLLCQGDFPGKNIGVGSHSLLQGIFPTQGSNPGFLHCRQTLYHPNLVLNVKTPWAGLATTLLSRIHQGHQLILEVSGQGAWGACSEQESPCPNATCEWVRSCSRLVSSALGRAAGLCAPPGQERPGKRRPHP